MPVWSGGSTSSFFSSPAISAKFSLLAETTSEFDSESVSMSTRSCGFSLASGGVMLRSLASKRLSSIGPSTPASLCTMGMTTSWMAGSVNSTSSFASNDWRTLLSSEFAATSSALIRRSGRMIGFWRFTSAVRAAS